MTKRPELDDVTNILNGAATINSNNDKVETAFDNTLSRDGSTPNQMEADLDMNSNDILNAGQLDATNVFISGNKITPASSTPTWIGNWATSTVYVVDNIVHEGGNSYICLEDHTSGTFSTDLAANKWQLMAAAASSGFSWKAAWVTSTAYVINDVVTEDNKLYLCLIAHTSGVFATDLAANRWVLLASQDEGDITSVESVTGEWTFEPTAERAITVSHPNSTAAIDFNKGASGRINRIRGKTAGVDRWAVDFGDSTSESGSDVGSDFTIKRFDDSGVLLEDALKIRRSSGQMLLFGELTMTNNDIIAFDLGNTIRVGSGTPEGSVSATVGSLYLNRNGGTGTALYVKESGSGNTGWVGK